MASPAAGGVRGRKRKYAEFVQGLHRKADNGMCAKVRDRVSQLAMARQGRTVLDCLQEMLIQLLNTKSPVGLACIRKDGNMLEYLATLFRLVQRIRGGAEILVRAIANYHGDQDKQTTRSHQEDFIGDQDECNSYFTRKMQNMLSDLLISKNRPVELKSNAFKRNKVDSSVQVRANYIWPMRMPSSSLDSVIPPAALRAFFAYRDFYMAMSGESRRTLALQPHRGHVLLAAEFYGPLHKATSGLSLPCATNVPAGSGHNEAIVSPDSSRDAVPVTVKDELSREVREHIFKVSTFQLCVLMLFNKKPTWTYKEIMAATKICGKDLQQVLRNLAVVGLSQKRNSTRNTCSRRIKKEDLFTINDAFYLSERCVDVYALECEPEPEPGSWSDHETYLLQAAIVRLLKARRSMKHPDLVVEVTKQLQESGLIQVPSSVINDCIEKLIDNDYIIRDHIDMNLYTYVA